MSEPQWTKATPTEPGWYWHRSGTSTPLPTLIVRRDAGAVLYAIPHPDLRREQWGPRYRADQIGGEWWPLPLHPPAETEQKHGS